MDEITRFYYVRRTIVRMLQDRGYLISSILASETEDEFRKKITNEKGEISLIRDKLTLLHQKKEDPTKQIFVFFPQESKVKMAPIKELSKKMELQNVDRAIIVYRDSITAIAKQALAEAKPLIFETFQETELMVNITEHKLVPPHIKLTTAETKKLLERYKLKLSQLPRITTYDPVAKYYGLQRGDVTYFTFS